MEKGKKKNMISGPINPSALTISQIQSVMCSFEDYQTLNEKAKNNSACINLFESSENRGINKRLLTCVSAIDFRTSSFKTKCT